MGNRIEVVFIRTGDTTGRQLHYQIDEKNRVQWRVLPKGEQGQAVFSTTQYAESFMIQNARILGFPKRLIGVQDSFTAGGA